MGPSSDLLLEFLVIHKAIRGVNIGCTASKVLVLALKLRTLLKRYSFLAMESDREIGDCKMFMSFLV